MTCCAWISNCASSISLCCCVNVSLTRIIFHNLPISDLLLFRCLFRPSSQCPHIP
jgi:hypothetical protein